MVVVVVGSQIPDEDGTTNRSIRGEEEERVERAEEGERGEEQEDLGVTDFENSDSKMGDSLIDCVMCEFSFNFALFRKEKVRRGRVYEESSVVF